MRRYLKNTLILTIFILLSLLLVIPVSGLASQGGGTGSWENVVEAGFGAGGDNLMALPFCEFRGELYVGIVNDDGAQVRSMSDGSWDAVSTPGFGDGDNLAITSMTVYGEHLYAGTLNLNGCQVWRYDGSVWAQVVGQDADGTAGTGPGFGSAGNVGAMSMEVHDSGLYVGTLNLRYAVAIPPSIWSDGAEIWCYNGAAWSEVVDGGFGDPLNAGVMSLKEYGGELYAGTIRVNIYFETGTLNIIMDGMGCELRRKGDSGWESIGEQGFGSLGNAAVMFMEIYDGKLFLGTLNGSLYVLLHLELVNLEIVIDGISLSGDGCCIYSYGGSEVEEEVTGGFGDSANLAAFCATSLSLPENDVLVVGVGGYQGEGTDDDDVTASLQVYDGKDWFKGAADGFGNPNNRMISSLWTWDGGVFAGTLNDEEGCEIWYGFPPPSLPPVITSIEPSWGEAGTEVTIKGSHFGERRGRSSVLFPAGIEASIVSWGDTSITCTVPGSAVSGEVVVKTAAGTSNGVLYDVDKPEEPVETGTTWYLAEGCTQGGFETWVLVQNPGDQPAEVTLTFMTDTGPVPGPVQTLGPNSRFSWNAGAYVDSYNVSTQVDSNQPVVAERAMYWNNRVGGHDSIGYSP
jgi:hypothetical protein